MTDGDSPDNKNKLNTGTPEDGESREIMDEATRGEDTTEGSSPATDEDARTRESRHVEELEPELEGTDWGREAYYHEDLNRHPAVRVLRTQFPEAMLDIIRFRNETTIHVRPETFRDVCRLLRDDERVAMDFLTDLTAVDMLRLRTTPRFDIVAQLYSLRNRVRLRVKAGINDGDSVPSLVPLWNGANWLERETYDLFGINFEGHPNLKRILLPDDWDEGHPLRKDYPVRGWKEFPVYNTERTVPRLRTRWTGRGV